MSHRRIALGIRYDGSAYYGWQRQDSDLPTVQSKLEMGLARVANHPIVATCAGRTDTGVHATSQVVHFDTEANRSDYSWQFGANSNLPPDISVTWAKEVPHDFHARFSATSRKYRYVIYNHEVKPGILRQAVGWHHRPLDENKMQMAAQSLLGEHDFSAFRGAACQSQSASRCVEEISIWRQRRLVIFEIKANAFLLHMVRNILGSLVEVGAGLKPVEWIKDLLYSKDRSQAGVTIAPNGLYLVAVDYPEHFQIPSNPIGPFFLP